MGVCRQIPRSGWTHTCHGGQMPKRTREVDALLSQTIGATCATPA